MFKPNQYQPLQASPVETNRYSPTSPFYSNGGVYQQQRRTRASALIFMIMLVATATLLTIIRLTISPGFSVPSRPPLISAQDSEIDNNQQLNLDLNGPKVDVSRKKVINILELFWKHSNEIVL